MPTKRERIQTGKEKQQQETTEGSRPLDAKHQQRQSTKEQVHRILQINLELVLLQDSGGLRPFDGCDIAIIITLQFESVKID